MGTLRHEGVRALWQGMSVPLFAQAVYKAILFSGFGASSRALSSFEASHPRATWYACGSFAGLCNSVCVCPVELIRNRLQIQKGQGQGPFGVAHLVVSANGVLGLWKGWGVTAIRDGLGVGAWFAAFRTAKASLQSRGFPEGTAVALGGCCAGVSFWTVALPWDCIKSVIQTSERNLTIVQALRILHVSPCSNWKRLYRGYSIALLRGLPAASLTFSVQHYVVSKLIEIGF